MLISHIINNFRNMNSSNWLYLTVLVLTLLHSLLASYFLLLEKFFPRQKRLLHALTEIEIIFPLWAVILCCIIFFKEGTSSLIDYIESLHFTEALFIIAIMTVAGTQPILIVIENFLIGAVKKLPFKPAITIFCITLTVLPLLGSFITEPAAMTVAVLLLKQTIFSKIHSEKLKYAILAILLVNISIGGALTPFAAPPILMVAEAWQWNLSFMFSHFALNILFIVCLNTLVGLGLFFKEIDQIKYSFSLTARAVNPFIVLTHILFIVVIMVFSHSPLIFLGLLVLFIAFTQFFSIHQTPLLLKESALVGLFLASLIVIESKQSGWLSPIISSMKYYQVYVGSALITAVTDNAALTYLGTLLPNPPENFKLALVKGAIAGGGLTLIANAPNPIAGKFLKPYFVHHRILAKELFKSALVPTLITLLGLMI
ncbi:hypothetical protein FERRO_16340 [Ferrovum sp. JA12]|nr:hypothetical protein FERRO_16340 [Ferrovum sp. JA12]